MNSDPIGEQDFNRKRLLRNHFLDCTCIDNISHPSHAKPGIHPFPDKLYVVTMLSNPLRFRNRIFNYHIFERHVQSAGAVLYTAEVAFGDRHFEITEPDNPRHLQLRSRHEIWLKENALNLLINRLPPDARYIAWIDADIKFVRPDWAQETLHLLQHYQFLQMFSHAQDIGPEYEPLITTPGYVYSKFIGQDDNNNNHNNNYYYGGMGWKYRHPGFCWAARREALDRVGGLIDWTILGSGDWVMACALFGEVDRALNPGYSDHYKFLCNTWQDRAERHIRRNVGYMPGTVLHMWHGRKKDRKYDTRWRLLVDTKFDPLIDLKRDCQGLFQLEDTMKPRSIALRDGLRKYARLRNEDNMNVG